MPDLNKTTLILQTRKELIESGVTEGQWDDTEIAEYLQESNELITSVAELEAEGTSTTVAGTETLAYPSGIQRILGIWARLPNSTEGWTKMRVGNIDERQVDDTAATRGKPYAYYIFAQKIYFIPVPDVAYDIKVFGHKAASDMVGGAGSVIPLFDNRFHYLLRLFAVARCKQKVDDPAYANYDGQYLAGVKAFEKELEKERNAEGPRMVKLVSPVW